MSAPTITLVRLGAGSDRPGSDGRPLLVLGPSLGTGVAGLWQRCAEELGTTFDVVGWELPGHGTSPDPAAAPYDLAELAAGVLAAVRPLLAARGLDRFHYAGDSVGGAVGLQLLLDAPGSVARAVVLATGARIGSPEGWAERAATVRASGTSALTEASAKRWFAPGFVERDPDTAAALLNGLQECDDEGYAQVCEALASYDVRDRLAEIDRPLLAVAGAHDAVTPTAGLAQIAQGVRDGRLAVLDDAAHLPPAERPGQVADLILQHLLTDPYQRGMRIRRAVLGDAHVDRAVAATDDFTGDFQELITRYAWGTIWTRPGLDRRSRSLITLTALVARGHHEELAMHVRAALRNGVTVEELKELFLQTAIYCGVPDANTAFRIAQRVLAERDD